jgi:hypothetical protein
MAKAVENPKPKIHPPQPTPSLGYKQSYLFQLIGNLGAGLTHAATERRSISENAVPIRLLAKIAVIRQLL